VNTNLLVYFTLLSCEFLSHYFELGDDGEMNSFTSKFPRSTDLCIFLLVLIDNRSSQLST